MKKNAYEISHIDSTIYMTKKFYKAACRLNTPEYKELMTARRDNPTYKMEVREIKKATNKNTYLNLTINNMGIFIENTEDDPRPANERLAEFERVKAISKSQVSPYAYVKTWFLKVYGAEYNKYREKTDNSKEKMSHKTTSDIFQQQ